MRSSACRPSGRPGDGEAVAEGTGFRFPWTEPPIAGTVLRRRQVAATLRLA